jgi:hypothetical protein
MWGLFLTLEVPSILGGRDNVEMEDMMNRNKWILFDCPLCRQPMRISFHQHMLKQGKEYLETYYKCDPCDISLRNRVPREKAATIVDERHFPPPLIS